VTVHLDEEEKNVKRRKGLALILCMLFVMPVVGCTMGKPASDENRFKVGLVTDVGGLNDGSFNQTAWAGCKRAESELDVDIKALESKRDEDYIPNLTRFAREGRGLIWGMGYKLEKAIADVAERFPDRSFAIVDSNLGGKIPKNVAAITFKEEEGSFLMGVIAGLSTKTNKVGFIGGIPSSLITKFEKGYKAGVKEVNPHAIVQVAYAESFTDATKGRSLARTMYDSGIDIIYHAAGGVGKGLFDEVKTRPIGKFWAIGVDMDQSHLAPHHTLSSMIKKVDVVVYDMIKAVKEKQGSFGKETQYGLKEGGVGYAANTSQHVKPEVLQKVEEIRQQIVSGEIQVPTK
jgi:basic membrane protein A and related proteins